MARMVPAAADPAAPDSEKRVFQLLKDDPSTRNWTVFHSLGFSSAYTGAYGEIDFVALIPGRGILCIEIKGGRVKTSGGLWTTTDRKGETAAYRRSPFEQAREGMFKLIRIVGDRFGRSSPEALCPVGWMVIFTDSPAPPSSPDFHRAELVDTQDLQRGRLGDQLRQAPSLAQSSRPAPEPSTLVSLGRFLRPDFDRVPTMSTTLWDAERRLVALTEDQYDVLDQIADNRNGLIMGGAGTGKTMLAVELARRLSQAGRSVLLTCFNRELGLWLEARAAEFGPGRVVAAHLHRLLRPRIESAGLMAEARSASDDMAWYEAGALAVAAGDERFEVILVDEAQDFPAGPLLDVLEVWRSPLDAMPSICLFGDFSRQALYDAPHASVSAIEARLHPARFPLRRNCRNTRRISAETQAITGSFDVRVSDQQPDGPTVERVFFSAGEQQKAVDRALQTMRSEGFNASDIVVLGSRRRENSVLAGVSSSGGFRIIERDQRQSHAGVIYLTIHAFKGLESPAIVLVDVEPRANHESDALLYVGMTRARIRLTMVMPEHCRAEIARREVQNLTSALSRS